MSFQSSGQPISRRMACQQTLLVSAPLLLLHYIWPAHTFTGMCLSDWKVLQWCDEYHNLLMTSSISSLV